MKIIAIRDRAVDAFGRPIFTRTANEGIRSFIDEINNPESPMNAHPEDYDLYILGDYDEDTGQIIPEQRPEMIAVGKNSIKTER